MKNTLIGFLAFVIICNVIISVLITIFSLCNNTYFNDYENLKSLRNKELYMNYDFLSIDKVFQDTGSGEGTSILFDVEGRLLSDNSKIKLKIGEQEFLGTNSDKQPLYKSKLTGDFFLKDATQEYYNDEIRFIYASIYFKFSFYIIIGIIIYITIRYIRNRRYRF